MQAAALLQPASPARLPVASITTTLQRSAVLRLDPGVMSDPLPGELACADDWHEIAKLLDAVAASIPKRMRGRGDFSDALASFIAGEVRGAAAEIRANLALEERDACIRACSGVHRHG